MEDDFERDFAVQARKVTRRWFKPTRTLTFYTPLYKGREFIDESAYPSVWGFDTEADAWKACDAKYDRLVEAEMEAYDDVGRGRGDREDFHADG